MPLIVGYFEEYERAEATVGELVGRCFGPDCIQIGRATLGKRVEEGTREKGDTPEVRGYYPDDLYEETAFVAVSAIEEETTGVLCLMRSHGAFCVVERPDGRQRPL